MTYFSRRHKHPKFVLVLFLLGLFLSFIKFAYVYAEDDNLFPSLAPTTIPQTVCGATDDLLVCASKWATKILQYLLFAAIAFAVIFIAYAGVEYIVLGKGESAKSRIIAAVVGLVIAFIAFVGVRMLVNTLSKGA